jgi:hypothetical protein
VCSMSWEQFCSALHDRFGRDQHEALIRQLFHIKQSGTVAEYVDRLSALVDQLTAYESTDNPLFYTMRFVDGLRDDIKMMVLIQRPSTLDTAWVLAMVQEEAADSNRRRDGRRFEPSFHRVALKLAVPLPVPPVLDKQTEEKHASGALYSEDKLRALKQYRRAQGLCDRRAEKWVPGHHCAPTVQLHAIQEMWDLLSDDEAALEAEGAMDGDSAQLYLFLFVVALTGVESVHFMRLVADIQGHQVVMPVDSGSSHSFISAELAKQCAGMSVIPQVLSVLVANGDDYQFKGI